MLISEVCPTFDAKTHRMAATYTDTVDTEHERILRVYDVEPIPVEEVREVRRAKVAAIAQPHLAALDAASTRPLRAILSGTAVPDDHGRLAELEASAAAWRVWQGEKLAALDAAETAVDVLAVDITVGWPWPARQPA